MEASIIDLRYKMNDVLKALERNERIIVLYRGVAKGVITSTQESIQKKVQDHPFFGMDKSKESVPKVMEKLRKGRYHDL